MGDYTECFIKCQMVENLPNDILNILKYMFLNSFTIPSKIPNHKFFSLPRWNYIGKGNSYYHIPVTLNHFEYDDISNCYYLISRSDIKNYDNEIEEFFDWIDCYIDEQSGKYIGYILTEYTEIPKLIFKK